MSESFRMWPVSTARDKCTRTSNARRARRLAPDSRSVHHSLRFQNLGVRDIDDDTVGLAYRAHRAIIRRRIADADCSRDGRGMHSVALAEIFAEARREGRRTGGLNRGESRHAVDQPKLLRLAKRRTERCRVAEIACWKHDPVRRLPVQLLEQFENDCLLSCDPIRV